VSTFSEYLLDYASPATREIGEALIAQTLQEMPEKQAAISRKLLERLAEGKRDCFV
jgi:2-iminoacetate synthase